MKNKIFKAVIFYAITIISLWLMGCKPKQLPPVIIKETKFIENSDYSRVKTELEKSKAINDSLFILIGNVKTAKPECDSICQDALEKFMQNVNTKKKSGGNSWGIYYDKFKKQLVIHASLEETVSRYRDSLQELKHIKSERIEVPVPAPYPVPAEFSREQNFNLWTGRLFWLVILAYLGFKIYKKISVWQNLKKLS